MKVAVLFKWYLAFVNRLFDNVGPILKVLLNCYIFLYGWR